MIQIHLKQSKCDQSGVVADVVVGRTGTDIYPVGAITWYLRSRGTMLAPSSWTMREKR